MLGEFGVPPDAGIEACGEIEAVAVGSRFGGGAIHVDEIRAGDLGARGFGFAGVGIDLRHLRGAIGRRGRAERDVDHVIVRGRKLGLREIGEQVVVAAVTVRNQDLLTTVATHFVRGFLQEFELQMLAIGDGSGFVAGFENLAEIIFGEDDGVFLSDSVEDGVADVDEICAEGEMGAVLFNDAEGEDADVLGLLEGSDEIWRGEFFPFDGEGISGVERASNENNKPGGSHGENCTWLPHSRLRMSRETSRIYATAFIADLMRLLL